MTNEILTSAESRALYLEHTGEELPIATLTQALRAGNIPGAVRRGRDWWIPRAGFIEYMTNRPRPGRPRKDSQ